MFERWTDRARKVYQFAKQSAIKYNSHIDEMHLLAGLLKESSGVAGNVLRNLDVDLTKIDIHLNKNIDTTKVTPELDNSFKLAEKEAKLLGHSYIGTEHLLLGLLEQFPKTFTNLLGVSADEVREEIHNLLGTAKPSSIKEQILTKLQELSTLVERSY